MHHVSLILRGAAVVMLSCLLTMPGQPGEAAAAGFGISVGAGHGVRHNDVGNGLFIRGMTIGENGAGCGGVPGALELAYTRDSNAGCGHSERGCRFVSLGGISRRHAAPAAFEGTNRTREPAAGGEHPTGGRNLWITL